MVPNFEWLEKYSDLTKEQVEFLKKYDKPFTIVTDSSYVKIWLNFVDEEAQEEFRNRGIYEKIAFRVANNKIQKKLTKEVGPIFLTSANVSGKAEMYSKKEIKEEFGEYIKKGLIKFLGESDPDLKKVNTSEVFEFVEDSLEQIFFRK